MSQQLLQEDAFGTPCLTGKGHLNKFNHFLTSPRFVIAVGLLTVAGNLFGAELIVYTLFILLGCYTALFGRDFLPLVCLVISSYIMPSIGNNPGQQSGSIFYPQNGGIYLLCLFAVFIGCVFYRLIRDQELGGKRFLKQPRQLLPGMLILGAGYILAGAFSGRYFEHGLLNLLFALVQFLAVSLVYWLLAGTIRWEKVRPDYLAWVGITAGLTVCCQIISIYIFNQVIRNSRILSGMIFSGWGNANNIGCMVAMMIPFAFLLARRTGKIWQFSTVAVVMVVFVCFTCSRTSILVAVLIYFASVLPLLKDAGNRKMFFRFSAVVALVMLALVLILHNTLSTMFEELVNRGLNPRNRDHIYPEGIRVFLQNPIFGEGFYPSSDKIDEWSTVEQLKSVFPARWHNTVIQLLASCGLVGLGCYSVHRIQTIRLFWKKRNTDALFIGLSLLALLLMSLLDCHFFNIGPTLFYSAALAFAEKLE